MLELMNGMSKEKNPEIYNCGKTWILSSRKERYMHRGNEEHALHTSMNLISKSELSVEAASGLHDGIPVLCECSISAVSITK